MLAKLVEWGRSCGLRFNPDKTVAVLFTRKRKIQTKFVTFEGKRLPYSQQVRYLGVELDCKLHWKPHIMSKIKTAKKLIMQISAVTSSSFGPCPKLMRWAFTGMVRPMLAYGALVWAHELNQQYIKDALQKINRLAINTFCVVARSTPTKALEVILDVTPLHIFCRATATATFFRIHKSLEFGWSGNCLLYTSPSPRD